MVYSQTSVENISLAAFGSLVEFGSEWKKFLMKMLCENNRFMVSKILSIDIAFSKLKLCFWKIIFLAWKKKLWENENYFLQWRFLIEQNFNRAFNSIYQLGVSFDQAGITFIAEIRDILWLSTNLSQLIQSVNKRQYIIRGQVQELSPSCIFTSDSRPNTRWILWSLKYKKPC